MDDDGDYADYVNHRWLPSVCQSLQEYQQSLKRVMGVAVSIDASIAKES